MDIYFGGASVVEGNQAPEKTREEWQQIFPNIYFGLSGLSNQEIMTDGETEWDMAGYKLSKPAKWVRTPDGNRRQREGDNQSKVAVGNPTTPLLRR